MRGIEVASIKNCCTDDSLEFAHMLRTFNLSFASCLRNTLRLCLRETEFVWNWYKILSGKLCVYTRPGRSSLLDRLSYPVPNVFTCGSDPVWNSAISKWYRDRCKPNTMDDYAKDGGSGEV